MDRVIITSTGSAAMRETIFEMGKPNALGNSVTTMIATQVGYAGSSLLPGKEDHRHPVYLLNTVQDVSFATSTAGYGEGFARGDHVHFAPPGSVPYGAQASNISWGTSTAGVAANASRGDHVHRVLPGVRVDSTGARATSQTYTNNGSGPMWVGISLSLSLPAADGAHLEVSGVHIAHGDGAANVHFFLMGVVNPTEQYLLTATGGAHIDHWIEYGF